MAAAVKASRAHSLLDTLVCGSVRAFYENLRMGGMRGSGAAVTGTVATKDTSSARGDDQRIISMDVKGSHVSISVSDAMNRVAVPFGIFSTTRKTETDGKLLANAFRNIGEGFQVAGLVVNIPPSTSSSETLTYTRELLMPDSTPFEALRAVLLYSEVHAFRQTLVRYIDFKNAVTQFPRKSMEAKRRSRFDSAMYPNLDQDDLINDSQAINRISSSEVLQTVLDEISSLERDGRSDV